MFSVKIYSEDFNIATICVIFKHKFGKYAVKNGRKFKIQRKSKSSHISSREFCEESVILNYMNFILGIFEFFKRYIYILNRT